MASESFLPEQPIMLNTPERIALMAALLKGGNPNPRFLRRAQIKLATVGNSEACEQMLVKEKL